MTTRPIGSMLLVAALAVLIIGPADARGQNADDAALRSFHGANGLLNRGMHDLAAAEYAAFLEAHPEHEEADVARYGLGVSCYRLSRHDDAIAALSAIGGGDGFLYAAECETLLGQCHLAESRFERAAQHFRNALDRHADHDLADDAAALLVESLYRDGRFDDVAEPCRTFIERWPDSPRRDRCELFGGLAEMARGRHTDSARRFRVMLRRSPDGPYADRVTLLLAQSLHHTGNGQNAIAHYRDVIRAATEDLVPDALYGLAVVLYGEGGDREKTASAAKLLDDLFDRFENAEVIPAARVLRGRIHLDAGAHEAASTLFTQVAKTRGPRQDAGQYWLAKCDLRRGRHDEAAQRLAEALERFPKSALAAEMTYDRAVALVRAGDRDDALEALAPFDGPLAESALAADALHLAATTQHEAQEYDASLRSCRVFRKRHPDHPLTPSIAFLAAENRYLDGDLDAAVEAYRAYLDDFPAAPQRGNAAYRLGMTLHALGRYDEAEPILADALAQATADAPFAGAVLVLGDLAFQRGDWAEAETRLAAYLADASPDAPADALPPPGADDALVKLGLARHRLGRLDEAIDAYTTLLETFPRSDHRLQAAFERGQALVALERGDEAVADFRQVLADGPGSRFAVHAFNHLAAIAGRAGEPDEAASWYELAARATDDDAMRGEALFQRAQSLMARERYEETAETLSGLLDDHPDHDRVVAARAHLAIALARTGRHEAALATLAPLSRSRGERGAALDPSLRATLAYEEAWCHRALGRVDAAAKAYRRLLDGGSIDDTQARGDDAEARGDDATSTLLAHARLELAELEANEGRFDAAAALLRPLADETTPASAADRDVHAQASYRLGVYEYSRKDFDAAAKRLDRFIDSHPESEHARSAHLLAGESLLSLGRHRAAETHLRKAADAKASREIREPALLRLGECLAVLQHWARSEEAFQEYLRSYADSELWFQARFGEGWACENQARYDDAIASYDAVVATHQGPTAARAQFQIGECLFAQKHLEEAARALLKVDILYAYPEWSAAALYEAGRCFQGLGDLKQAKKQFEIVRANHGDTSWARLAVERLDEIARETVSTALPGR